MKKNFFYLLLIFSVPLKAPKTDAGLLKRCDNVLHEAALTRLDAAAQVEANNCFRKIRKNKQTVYEFYTEDFKRAQQKCIKLFDTKLLHSFRETYKSCIGAPDKALPTEALKDESPNLLQMLRTKAQDFGQLLDIKEPIHVYSTNKVDAALPDCNCILISKDTLKEGPTFAEGALLHELIHLTINQNKNFQVVADTARTVLLECSDKEQKHNCAIISQVEELRADTFAALLNPDAVITFLEADFKKTTEKATVLCNSHPSYKDRLLNAYIIKHLLRKESETQKTLFVEYENKEDDLTGLQEHIL